MNNHMLCYIQPLTIAINGLSAAADVLIATSLVILLRRARTGFKKYGLSRSFFQKLNAELGILTGQILQ